MSSTDKQYLRQFEILRQIAVDGAAERNLEECVRRALSASADLLELSAIRVMLWDSEFKTVLNVTHSAGEREEDALNELEEDVFRSLRQKRRLRSAFLVFDGEPPAPPLGAFTVPLHRGPIILGAALGVREGDDGLMKKDHFLKALASALSLAVIAQLGETSSTTAVDQRRIDEERLKAALEIAVTVNHEINNPLTAALGNVQLLLMDKENLSPDLLRKLEVIEKSTMQIRDVTQRLLSLTEAKPTTYVGDETMIDLGGSHDESKKEKPDVPDDSGDAGA